MNALETLLTDHRAFALVATRLQAGRQAAGLSLDKASAHAHLSADQLDLLEKGTPPQRLATIARLIACYGLEPRAVFADLAPVAGYAISDHEISILMSGFLTTDQPDRGQLFRDFITRLRDESEPS